VATRSTTSASSSRVISAYLIAGCAKFTIARAIARLRKLDYGPERERHLFNMIRISERAWAGILTDLEQADKEIEAARFFCSRNGV
jgi:hypothetical protein